MARRRALRQRSETASPEACRTLVPRKCIDYKPHFPLGSVFDVVKLLQLDLSGSCEPNLAFWSVLLGILEARLTNSAPPTQHQVTESVPPSEDSRAWSVSAALSIPTIDYSDVKAIFDKFEALVKTESPASTRSDSGSEARGHEYAAADYNTVTRIKDSIWKGLGGLGSYEKAHLQFLTSYVTGYQLDSFGCAVAVVAAGQLLNYADMHLALSEGHVWLAFGPGCGSRIEVSWHGKNPDTRKSITDADMKERWLYSGGQPLLCDRIMELAMLFSIVNPSQGATADSLNLTFTQYCLLHSMYAAGKLSNCPQAHVALAEAAERMSTAPGLPPTVFLSCERLYKAAVLCSRQQCSDVFIYPYLALAAFYYRKGQHLEAFKCWTAAARVLGRYTYTAGDDDEPYKDFHEVVSEKIPSILTTEPAASRSPMVFSYIVRIVDGLCKWEEGSNCAVLHAGWAKNVAVIASKFEFDVRRQVKIEPSSNEESPANEKTEFTASSPQHEAVSDVVDIKPPPTVVVQLASRKMSGLRKLLVAEKVSMEAVQLQMAAQVGTAARKHSSKRLSSAALADEARLQPPAKRACVTTPTAPCEPLEKNTGMEASCSGTTTATTTTPTTTISTTPCDVSLPQADASVVCKPVMAPETVNVTPTSAPALSIPSGNRNCRNTLIRSFASARGVCVRSSKGQEVAVSRSSSGHRRSAPGLVRIRNRPREPRPSTTAVQGTGDFDDALDNGADPTEDCSLGAAHVGLSHSETEQNATGSDALANKQSGVARNSSSIIRTETDASTSAKRSRSSSQPAKRSRTTAAADVAHDTGTANYSARRRARRHLDEDAIDDIPANNLTIDGAPITSKRSVDCQGSPDNHSDKADSSLLTADALSKSTRANHLAGISRRRALHQAEVTELEDMESLSSPERKPSLIDSAPSPPVHHRTGPGLDVSADLNSNASSISEQAGRRSRPLRHIAAESDKPSELHSSLRSSAHGPGRRHRNHSAADDAAISPSHSEGLATCENHKPNLSDHGSSSAYIEKNDAEAGCADPAAVAMSPHCRLSADVVVRPSAALSSPTLELLPSEGPSTPAANDTGSERSPAAAGGGGDAACAAGGNGAVEIDAAENNPVLLSTRRRQMALASATRRGLRSPDRFSASAIQKARIQAFPTGSGLAVLSRESSHMMVPAVQLQPLDSTQLSCLTGYLSVAKSEADSSDSAEVGRKSGRRRSNTLSPSSSIEESLPDKRSSATSRAQRAAHRAAVAAVSEDGLPTSDTEALGLSTAAETLSDSGAMTTVTRK